MGFHKTFTKRFTVQDERASSEGKKMQASSTGAKVPVRGILLRLVVNAALPVAPYLLSKRSLTSSDLGKSALEWLPSLGVRSDK